MLLDGSGDLEGVLFFERPSPFLSSELQRKLQALPPIPKWNASAYNKELPAYDIQAVLGDPSLDAISSVNIDPASMLVEGIADTLQAASDFIENPTVAGFATLAAAAIPGRYAEKVTDGVTDKVVDLVKDAKAKTKVDLDDIGSTATDLGVVPNTFERPTIGTQIDDQVRLVDTAKLPPWTVETFRNGEFVTVETTESVTLFRKFGGGPSQAKLDGAYASTVQNASRQETAVYPAWSNSRFEAELVVPNGQTLSIGAVGQQPPNSLVPKYRGGADQILLPRNWATDWVKSVRDGKTGIVYSFDEFKTAFPDQVSRGK